MTAGKRHLAIGLTGGVGCGKTTVTDEFEKLGVDVIDADIIARDIVAPGSPLLDVITDTFGNDMLLASGELDRRKMREKVFSSTQARRKLESILHPEVGRRIEQRLGGVTSHYAIVSVPLLVESNMAALVDRIAVIDCDEETQIKRVMARDNSSREQALAIIQSQATREQRLAIADDIIDNNTSLEALYSRIHRLHHDYLVLARSK